MCLLFRLKEHLWSTVMGVSANRAWSWPSVCTKGILKISGFSLTAGLNGLEKACLFPEKMIRNKNILFAFRLVVGGVFIWAGILKIIDPLGFAQSIANYRIFPSVLSFFLAVVLPWIEVVCGVFLVFGIFRHASSLLFSGLLGAFLLLMVVTLLRGIDVDCGCFGSLSQELDYKLILTDSVLLFFSLNIFFSHR